MMKNKILIIILVAVLLVSCVVLGGIIAFNNDILKEVNDDNLILTCESEEIGLNEEIKCILKGNVDEYDVSAVNIKIEDSKDYKVNDVLVDSSWQGDGEDNLITLYTDDNKSKKFNIATFSVSLINNNIDEFNINLVDITLGDDNYNEHTIQNVSKTLKVRK